MRKFFNIILILLTILICLKSQFVFADITDIFKQIGISENISFSSDMYIDSRQNSNLIKILYRDNNLRFEVPQTGNILIFRKDGMMFSFNNINNIWGKKKMSFSEVLGENDVFKMNPIHKIKAENIDDKNCERFETEDPKTGEKIIIWVSEGMIYKISNVNPFEPYEIKFKNIEKKAFENKLFSPPEGISVSDLA